MKELNRNLRLTEKAAGHKTVDDATEHKPKSKNKKQFRKKKKRGKAKGRGEKEQKKKKLNKTKQNSFKSFS